MNRKHVFFALLVLSSASVCLAQQQIATPDVYVESWKAGPKIREQTLKFDLTPQARDHTTVIRDAGIGSYKLVLRLFPEGQEAYQLEYWAVELKQVLSGEKQKERLGYNLLAVEAGSGGDNFPREDLVGILYPREVPKTFLEKLRQPNGGYYPISAKRVIKVQNFYVIIQVASFKLNATDPKKLDAMNVTIEFKNSYKNGAGCKEAPSNKALQLTAR